MIIPDFGLKVFKQILKPCITLWNSVTFKILTDHVYFSSSFPVLVAIIPRSTVE